VEAPRERAEPKEADVSDGDEIERWLHRAQLYRYLGMPAETREAARVAARIVNTVDLARGAIHGIEQVNEEARAAEQRSPRAHGAISDVEAAVYMVLPAIVGRYGDRL
jgi:hypothetical protein